MQKKNKKSIRLAMVGRTGAGKTTLINMLTNLIMRKNYKDKREFAITQRVNFTSQVDYQTHTEVLKCTIPQFETRQSENPNPQGQMHSQTTKCNFYGFSTKDYDLTFIDTPGVGDSRGHEQDKANVQAIVNAVAAMGDIHGIILVHKSSDVRLDESTKFMIQQIRGLLTKDYKDNFMVVFTHAANSARADATRSLNELGINVSLNLNFQNECLIPFSISAKYQDQDDLPGYETTCQMNWENNRKTFMKFNEKILSLSTKDGSEIKNLHIKKTVLLQAGYRLADLVYEQNSIEMLFNEEKANLEEIKKVVQQTRDHNNYGQVQIGRDNKKLVEKVVKKMVPKYVKKDVNKTIEKFIKEYLTDNKKATICLSCKNTCHLPCGMEFNDSDGTINFKSCHTFQYKTICQNCNHEPTDHAHRGYVYVKKFENVKCQEWTTEMVEEEFIELVEKNDTVYDTLTIQRVDQKMKMRYEDAIAQLKRTNESLAKAQTALTNINKIKDSYLKMIAHLYEQINEICLVPINDFFEQYIEVNKRSIQNDTNIPAKEKNRSIRGLDKMLEAYKQIKLVSRSNMVVALSPDEKKEYDRLLSEVRSEEEAIIDYYRNHNRQNTSSMVIVN